VCCSATWRTWPRSRRGLRNEKPWSRTPSGDLPDRETREQIFQIHLDARGHNAHGFDLVTLAAHTEGFSGSEMEEVGASAISRASPVSSGGRKAVRAYRSWDPLGIRLGRL